MAAVDVVPAVRVLAVDGQPHAGYQLEHSLHDDHHVRLVHLVAEECSELNLLMYLTKTIIFHTKKQLGLRMCSQLVVNGNVADGTHQTVT